MVEINSFKTDVIDDFSNSIKTILDKDYKKFLNEGTICFELSKSLTLIEENKDNIFQNFPDFIDVSIPEQELYIEIKYIRGIPSNEHIPVTNRFGQILNDMAKLSEKIEEGYRIVVVITEQVQINYFESKDTRRPVGVLYNFVGKEGSIFDVDEADIKKWESVPSVKDKIKYDLRKVKNIRILIKKPIGELTLIVYLINGN